MTFDEVMKKYDGAWESGRAVIKGTDGYLWTLATGEPKNFTLTSDGKRYVTTTEAATEKPKRGRKLSPDVESVDV